MHPFFLSVVVVVRNKSAYLHEILEPVGQSVRRLVTDYDLIVVDNGSDDDSVAVLRDLTRQDGLPNLQVFALAKEVDFDTACWAGVENALGDYVLVLDPQADDLSCLPQMLQKALEGSDVVFARNTQVRHASPVFRFCSRLFHRFYNRLAGINLAQEAPRYRLLSRRVVNFLLQHPSPRLGYRHLPATAGFPRAHILFSATPRLKVASSLWESIDQSLRLLTSTTRAPLRLITLVALFGALANLVYSLYVIGVMLFKSDVAPGWGTLSLQQSGMFFLLSLVLVVLGEYVLQMTSLSHEGPMYHIAQEFTSAHMQRLKKLNIENSSSPPDVQVEEGGTVPVLKLHA